MDDENSSNNQKGLVHDDLAEVKPPKWFIGFAVIALLWNLIGVLAFVTQVTITPEALGQLPEAEQSLYINMPFWANAAFAVAVFGSMTASFMLICKMYWAVYLFSASLLGIIVQFFHAFVMSEAYEVFGPSGLIIPAMVIVLAIVCLLVSLKAQMAGWLN